MKLKKIVPAWAGILRGHRPFLSLEITRECPLRCPGCYAYEPNHLGTGSPLRQLSDFNGEALVAGVLGLVCSAPLKTRQSGSPNLVQL
jgi:hypothetical protein